MDFTGIVVQLRELAMAFRDSKMESTGMAIWSTADALFDCLEANLQAAPPLQFRQGTREHISILREKVARIAVLSRHWAAFANDSKAFRLEESAMALGAYARVVGDHAEDPGAGTRNNEVMSPDSGLN